MCVTPASDGGPPRASSMSQNANGVLKGRRGRGEKGGRRSLVLLGRVRLGVEVAGGLAQRVRLRPELAPQGLHALIPLGEARLELH
eukprot:2524729-Pyramimonas_sp.AAC.1